MSVSEDFVLMEGGVPVVVDGATLGAVGVSGVQANQDAQIAAAGVAGLQQ
jgi:glc operon protein GlcG